MSTRTYTREEIEQSFHTEVNNFMQDAKRVPERDSSNKERLRYAKELYNKNYRDALHVSVLDRYK